jgi:hypothetical protein
VQHKELAAGKWGKLSFVEQMANIGSEVERAISWRNKNNAEYSRLAFDRALELLDLTIGVSKGFPKLKELLRVREALVDYFVYDNAYKSTEQSWRNYFLAFNYAARLN